MKLLQVIYKLLTGRTYHYVPAPQTCHAGRITHAVCLKPHAWGKRLMAFMAVTFVGIWPAAV